MASEPLDAAFLASAASVLACVALSAFCLVIEDISSRLEDVSSRPAACSVAPWASDCEAADTCVEAEATWSAPSRNSPIIRLIGSVIAREMNMPKAIATITPTTADIKLNVFRKIVCALECWTCSSAPSRVICTSWFKCPIAARWRSVIGPRSCCWAWFRMSMELSAILRASRNAVNVLSAAGRISLSYKACASAVLPALTSSLAFLIFSWKCLCGSSHCLMHWLSVELVVVKVAIHLPKLQLTWSSHPSNCSWVCSMRRVCSNPL